MSDGHKEYPNYADTGMTMIDSKELESIRSELRCKEELWAKINSDLNINHAKELTTLRSQVERLTGERDESLERLKEARELLDEVTGTPHWRVVEWSKRRDTWLKGTP